MTEETKKLFEKLTISQLSPGAMTILEKLHNNEALLEQDLDMLLNASETAAVLSVKYDRPIDVFYIRELTRSFTNPKTGHVTPARLNVARKASNAQLYRLRDVLAVKMRSTRQAKTK